jgi:hypothetical protein
MLINILFGFFVPWIILGTYLFKKDKKILLLIFPLGSTLALTINLFGFHFEFWDFKPLMEVKPMSALPLDLGLYPLLGCYYIFLTQRYLINPYIGIFLFSFVVTGMEWVAVQFEKVIYYNGWNIGWTFLSYLVPFIIIYCYYRFFNFYQYIVGVKK